MIARNYLLAGLAVGATLALAQMAGAQTTPTTPTPPPVSYGPPIAGYCTFSLNQIIAQSKVGQVVVARLKQLDAAWRAELQPQADAINTDKRALDAQAATLDRAALDAREGALEERVANLQKLAQQREQEMQATQQKEIGVVQTQLDPILRQLFQQHACSVLVERDQGGVAVVNPAMDLSTASVTGLDAHITTLTFDRVHLDQQPAGTTPAAR